MANETAFVAQIKRYLKSKGAYCEKIWGGGFQSAGIPDIIGCYKGYFIGIEAKVGNNKPSEIQKAKITLVSPVTIQEGSAHDVTVRNTTSVQN